MKTSRIATLAGVTLAGIMLVVPVSQAKGWFGKHSADRKVEYLSDELKLDESQQQLLTEFVENVEDHFENMMDSRRELHDKHEDEAEAFWLRPLLTADEIKQFRHQQRQSMATVMTEFMDAANEKLATFHNSLNEDQREEFAEFMAESHGFMRMGGRDHRRRSHD